MNGYPPTPRMTQHARDRCREMGVKAKRAKAVVRKAEINRPTMDSDGRKGRVQASWSGDPEICVIYEPAEPPIIVTVIWNTGKKTTRELYMASSS